MADKTTEEFLRLFPAGFTYGKCKCTVHKLAIGYEVGRCRNCHGEIFQATEEEYLNK